METSIAQATTRSGSGTAFSTATTIAPDRAGTTTTPPPQQHPTDDPAATLDIRSLTYLSQLDDHILCPICKTPFLNPITTPCRHTFCADCLATALAATDAPPTCPIDRGPLRPEDTRPAPIVVANLVDGLLVACPNAGKGCMVGCARYLVEGHLREECGYVEVACPGEGCKERVLRKDLRERCLHGIVECEFCLDRVREMDLKVSRSGGMAVNVYRDFMLTALLRVTGNAVLGFQIHVRIALRSFHGQTYHHIFPNVLRSSYNVLLPATAARSSVHEKNSPTTPMNAPLHSLPQYCNHTKSSSQH